MIPRNCLSFVLDRLVSTGGYGAFRGSDHSGWGLHVLHISPEGVAHYAPGAPLDNPAQSLMGFDGVAWDRELTDAKPVSVRAIVISAWIFALGATAWALARRWRRMWFA